MATSEAKSSCPLLDLPAELRNRIYCLALLRPDIIVVPRTSFGAVHDPGLLSANRQTRKEAAGIYYHENTFSFDVTGMDAARYIAAHRQSPHIRGIHNLWYYDDDLVIWSKLLAWLKAWYDGECKGLPDMQEGDDDCPNAEIVIQMFVLVAQLTADGLDWDAIGRALEVARRIAAVLGGDWEKV